MYIFEILFHFPLKSCYYILQYAIQDMKSRNGGLRSILFILLHIVHICVLCGRELFLVSSLYRIYSIPVYSEFRSNNKITSEKSACNLDLFLCHNPLFIIMYILYVFLLWLYESTMYNVLYFLFHCSQLSNYQEKKLVL